MTPSRSIDGLIAIMAALRTPETGCAWDLEQSFATIAPYTIEEAYEVADAIKRQNMPDLCEELGDLLLQVVFHAQMAEELGHFTFADLCEAITTKLIRRHPHVFGDARDLPPEAVKSLWQEIKDQEKAEKRLKQQQSGSKSEPDAFLADVPSVFPALTQAVKLQKKAARVGFDWSELTHVIEKLDEEVLEFKQALAQASPAELREEFGDILFVMTNIARKLDIDPEAALNGCNDKFRSRFGYIEQALRNKGQSLDQASLDDMEALWIEAKHQEKSKNI